METSGNSLPYLRGFHVIKKVFIVFCDGMELVLPNVLQQFRNHRTPASSSFFLLRLYRISLFVILLYFSDVGLWT